MKRGTPNRKKVNKVTINAPSIAAILSFCIFFHYQYIDLASSLQSGRRTIFNMGGTTHENARCIRPNTTLIPWAFFSVGENIGLNTPKKRLLLKLQAFVDFSYKIVIAVGPL
jgi:hypothetical protein